MKCIVIVFILFSFGENCFSQQPRLMLPIGHNGWVEITRFSPDNKFIISSSDKELMIWDVGSKKLLSRLNNHTRKINSVSFSASGKYFVTASNDSTAKIWETRNGTLLLNLKDPSGMLIGASFTPDEKFLLTYSYKSIKIWDIVSGKVVLDSIGQSWDNIISGTISPDGKYILKAGDYKSNIYKFSTGELVKKLDDPQSPHTTENIFANFSHDGKLILSAGDHTPKIWNAEKGQIVRELKGHNDKINIAIFSPADKTILTVSEFNEAPKLWDVSTGNLIAELIGHKNMVSSASFSQDGQMIITASWDGTAKVWNAMTGRKMYELNKHVGDLYTSDFSPNGKMIVTAGRDETLKIWDAMNGSLIGELKGHTLSFGKSFSSMISDSMFAIDDKKVIAWNTINGTLAGYLSGHKNWINSIAASNNNKFIASGDSKGTTIIWQANSLSVLFTIDHHKKAIESIGFSNKDKYIITSSLDSTVCIWDANDGKLISQIKDLDEVREACLSNAGDKLITYSKSGVARVWNIANKKLLYEIFHRLGSVWSAVFSPDDKYIVSCSGNYLVPKGNEIILWNSLNGNPIAEYKDDEGWGFEKVYFSPDSKYILANAIDGNIWVCEFKKNRLIKTILDQNDKKGSIQQVAFSSDNQYIVSSSKQASAKIWKLGNSKLVKTLMGHTDYINTAVFSPDNKYVITASGDRTSKKWNSKTGELLCTFLALDSIDYITQTPSGYYQCSPAAAKLLHYVTKDLKIITFEQLDVKYNRPDKVLEAIGNTDTALIRSYRKAYEKRIKKLGIDTIAFRSGYSVPEADFANREKIKYEQFDGKLKLNIRSVDSTYRLDRFNVWVNETPLYGQRGISLHSKSSNNFDSTISIELSQGVNKIETSITNVNGTESYRMPLIVNYSPANSQNAMTYFIGIGIDEFAQSKYNLKYSTKDIRDLSKKLKEKYKDIIIDTLFNEDVTISKVKALKQKLLQTNVNDKVIISYSGHGMLSKEFDYYLSTYAVNFDKPEENGLPYDELESLLDSIPARKKLMLIDACHSGEVDKEDLVAMNATDNKLIKGLKPVAYKKEGQLGLKNSFELMQSLFVNVGKSTGATIISAAAGTQFALEGVNNLPNGVFTYCILEAMNKYPTMKLSELKKIVGDRVVEITKGLQKPTSRNETIAVDWELW